MPLTDQNRGQLYADAFATNIKAVHGEQIFQSIDLKTQLDVAKMEIGVLNDELAAEKKAHEDTKEKLAAFGDSKPPQEAAPQVPLP